MKTVLPFILIVLISANIFAQSTSTKAPCDEKKKGQPMPSLEETIRWLNDKFDSSVVLAFSYEKKCLRTFELKATNTEIIAIKKYNCDGTDYEITYTIPFKSLENIDDNAKGGGPPYVAVLALVLKCNGGDPCITKQYKDNVANTTKTTKLSSFDSYTCINAKCMNAEIKERIINALNNAILLNGGGKKREEFE